MQHKHILITGCSSGIGYDSALVLANRGHQVIASCRKSSDLEKLTAKNLTSVYMNVADPASIAQSFAEVLKKTGGKLDILINNAGYGQIGALEDINYDTMYQQFATNVFGLMELSRLAIPVMRQQSQGRIINISSLLGIVSMPLRGAYNASKYAVEGLSDTLRLELKSSGIDVITIQPGPIASRFRDNALDYSLGKIDIEVSYFRNQYHHMLKSFREKKMESIFTQGTDAVIKKLIHAIESTTPRAKYPVTFPSHVFTLLKRVLSVRMLDRLMTYISKKELR